MGFSLWWLLLLQSTGFRACGLSHCGTGLVAPMHVGSSRARDLTHASCLDRWILNTGPVHSLLIRLIPKYFMAVIAIMDEIFTITLIIHNWIWLVEKKIITLVFSYFIDFLLLLFASFSTVILNLLGKQSYHWWRMSLMTSYPESILCLYFLFSFIAGTSKTVYPHLIPYLSYDHSRAFHWVKLSYQLLINTKKFPSTLV